LAFKTSNFRRVELLSPAKKWSALEAKGEQHIHAPRLGMPAGSPAATLARSWGWGVEGKKQKIWDQIDVW
jgi:hypothetical protein